MAFDVDFRNEVLSQMDYQTTTKKSMEITKSDKKTPLNQILFGVPGTGKTYNTKRIAVEIIVSLRPKASIRNIFQCFSANGSSS